MTKSKHKNRTIIFNADEHSYSDDRDCRYTSTTTLVKSFFPLFDPIKVASYCAGKGKYEGMDSEQVRKAWNYRRDLGTAVHEMAEELITERKEADDYKDKEHANYIPILLDIKADLMNKGYELVECEKIIFSPQYLVSGTVDAIFKHKETGEYLIVDWKTNEEIKQKNYSSKGLGVLKYLDNCNYIHYCLQLNVYERLLIEESYYPYFDFKKVIVHIKEDKFEYYEVPKMDKELDVILTLF